MTLTSLLLSKQNSTSYTSIRDSLVVGRPVGRRAGIFRAHDQRLGTVSWTADCLAGGSTLGIAMLRFSPSLSSQLSALSSQLLAVRRSSPYSTSAAAHSADGSLESVDPSDQFAEGCCLSVPALETSFVSFPLALLPKACIRNRQYSSTNLLL